MSNLNNFNPREAERGGAVAGDLPDKPLYALNGRTLRGLWRIDQINAYAMGWTFMNRPTALVVDQDVAERIVALLNSDH